jgi:hypothetical protein
VRRYFLDRAVVGLQPVILLRNVDRALIESVSSGRPGTLLLQARGAGSKEIVVASGSVRCDGGDGLELFEAGK